MKRLKRIVHLVHSDIPTTFAVFHSSRDQVVTARHNLSGQKGRDEDDDASV